MKSHGLLAYYSPPNFLFSYKSDHLPCYPEILVPSRNFIAMLRDTKLLFSIDLESILIGEISGSLFVLGLHILPGHL